MKLKFLHLISVFLLCACLLCGCGTDNPAEGTGSAGTDAAELSSGTAATDEPPDTSAPPVTTESAGPHVPAERDGWSLDGVPAFTKGRFDGKKLNGGRGVNTRTEAEYVHNITGVSADDYKAYLSELDACGFTREYEKEKDGNLFSGFEKDGVRVYTYYLGSQRTVRVIRDPLSVSLDDFGYALPDGISGDSVLYAYGLQGTGQLLLWQLPDNSWIINDGGTESVASAPLFAFLCRHSGIDPDGTDKLTVRLWYITHAHNDHATGVIRLLNAYHDRIALERVMWNVPEQSVISTSQTKTVQSELGTLMTRYYKDALFLKLHTGMDIRIGDVVFSVLMTQEDNLLKFVDKEYTDFNSTSTVCTVSFGGTGMFLPGDMKNGSLDDFVCKVYKFATYGLPIVQVAHHGYNSMKAWYSLTLPGTQYAIFENTLAEGTKQGSGPTVYQTLGPGKCFFTDKTWVFAAENGVVTVTSE